MPGFDPSASRMLSERSTNWSTSPSGNKVLLFLYLAILFHPTDPSPPNEMESPSSTSTVYLLYPNHFHSANVIWIKSFFIPFFGCIVLLLFILVACSYQCLWKYVQDFNKLCEEGIFSNSLYRISVSLIVEFHNTVPINNPQIERFSKELSTVMLVRRWYIYSTCIILVVGLTSVR